MSFEYMNRVCSISTILNPSSTPSCIAQFPTCSDNSFNTSSSEIRCSAMLSIPIKTDLFHQISKYLLKYFIVTRLTRRVSLMEQELLTLPEHLSSPPGFQWGSCYSIFSLICTFCRWLFVLLYFFFWSLCCLFFFDVRILIAPLVSSNSSFIIDYLSYEHNFSYID